MVADEKVPEVKEKIRWRSWCPEAFAEAQGEDKLVLLDIGAKWCHWCHVMDRTTYLDDATAEFINGKFIPVRLDRDEHPDLDRRYQSAPTLLESPAAGGWPLTVFLLPSGEALYRATYLPPRGRGGLIGVAGQVLGIYTQRRRLVDETADKLRSQIDAAHRTDLRGSVSAEALEVLFAELDRQFDETWGGFGSIDGGPKFPSPGACEFLMALARRTGSRRATAMLNLTMEKMAEGGLYDQLGGGFHRYAVDPRWRVPHFEKLLYDNAELLTAYLHAFQFTGRPEFRHTSEGILKFVGDLLTDQQRGGFYGSQDADVGLSDDGDYFTWSLAEVRQLLEGDELRIFVSRYDIGEVGEMAQDRSRNVLWQAMSVERLARGMGLPPEEGEGLLAEAERKIREARSRRPAPKVDPTVYVSWNGMMIRACVEAAQILDRPDCLALARRAADRLLAEVADGGARWEDGSFTHVAGANEPRALLEDQAWMALALTELFEATGDQRYLAAAQATVRWANEHLWDASGGGYFDRLPDPDDLGMSRLPDKPVDDNPSSSASAVMALALQRLAALNNELTDDYAMRAHELLASAARAIETLGVHGGALALAAEIELSRTFRVTVVGSGPAAAALVRATHATYVPSKVVALLDPANPDDRQQMERLGYQVEKPTDVGGAPQAVAYVCRGRECLTPVTAPENLVKLLKQR
jgi:hypothetical protein